MNFEAKVTHINNQAIILIPASVDYKLPSRGLVMGSVQIDDERFILPLEPSGYQGHWFYVPDNYSNDVFLKISIEVSEIWIEPHLNEDIKLALTHNHLLSTWQDLTVKARWEWFRWIRFTKNPNTRSKRINTMISMLNDQKRRPCCFDHSRCTDMKVSKGGKLLI
ncbi:MAG: YdeI/OmpD-associated family protein [Tissierellales bacterium]|nr:YdeI/OmpD-associated family protein [Tissierellales bacterium]